MSRHQIAPAWQTSRGPIVQAHGCAVGVPVAGARVFGETRQNLWPMLGSVNRSGVEIIVNDDGSIKASGISTANAATDLVQINNLVPGKEYSISGTGNMRIQFVIIYESGGSSVYVTSKSEASNFTLASDAANIRAYFQVLPGETVNDTFYPMLNEGPTAEPWCPPGLSSVSELETVTAGKNLLKINSDLQTKTMNGVTFTPNEDGTVTVNGTSTDTSDYYLLGTSWATRADNYLPGQEMVFSSNGRAKLYGFDSSGSTSFYAILNGGNQIISAEQIIKAEKIVCYLSYASGQGETNKKVYAQLELGPTATAYEPPHVTTTPIDLSGHELRGLPDGTRDVLTVDGSGAVSVEQAVECVTYDGSSDETGSIYESHYGHFFHLTLPGKIGGDASWADTGAILCDTLPVNKSDVANSKTGIWFLKDYRSAVYVKPPVELASFEDFRSWLAQHPVTVIYPGATPLTVHLDPITPPTVPASDATLWAATDVPCDLEATTWTASGAEQGRQQAAMVKVAQQVRQQAETVAALTTQALEA